MTDHPCKGLPASARSAFEALTINQQPRCRKKTLDLLLDKGLIERGPDRIVGRDPLGLITIPEYFVPMPVHMQFCQWAAEQSDILEEVVAPEAQEYLAALPAERGK